MGTASTPNGGSLQRLDKYELQQRLGRGGMAEVWKALDTQLHRYVAIKLLHPDLQNDPDFITRFLREARVVASLHHPNIVQIYDFQILRDESGTSHASGQGQAAAAPYMAYMVMEYIEGQTLASYITKAARQWQRQRREDGQGGTSRTESSLEGISLPIPAQHILHLFASISRAVDYAHVHGIVHRDIKPANILLDARNTTQNPMGEPILTDFGLVKLLGASTGSMSGSWLGTPLYIAPEQAQGYPGNERSDIYALGVILYEMCTGALPFSGDTPAAIMRQHISAQPVSPVLLNPMIPPPLAMVILRCLSKDPATRFASASSLTAAIADALNLPVPVAVGLVPAHAPVPDVTSESTHVGAERNLGGYQGSSGQAQGTAPTYRAHPYSITSAPQVTPPPVSTSAEPLSRALTANRDVPSSHKKQAIESFETFMAPSSPLPAVSTSASHEKSAAEGFDGSTPSFLSAHPAPAQALPPDSSRERNKLRVLDKSAPFTPFPASPLVTPLSTPPPLLGSTPPKAPKAPDHFIASRGMRIALAALLILVLLSSGIGAFFFLQHQNAGSPIAANAIVGHAYFLSSGQLNENYSQGNNDQLQIELQNIPDPAPGTSYYAWLLGDSHPSADPASNHQVMPPLFLGKLSVNSGYVHFTFPGDQYHTNLIAFYSRLLVAQEATQENALFGRNELGPYISAPLTDKQSWRYYAEIPQIPSPTGKQHFSALDNIRHLLYEGPRLQQLGIHGGLNVRLLINTQKILEWVSSARDSWQAKDTGFMRRQLIRTLDYLDGKARLPKDVPAGTPILVDPLLFQIPMLDDTPGHPISYSSRMNGQLKALLSSPGITADIRTLALQADHTLLKNMEPWLEEVHKDAVQLIHMTNAQLQQPAALSLLDDMQTYTSYAFAGRLDPATDDVQPGVVQVYYDIQRLAVFNITPYSS